MFEIARLKLTENGRQILDRKVVRDEVRLEAFETHEFAVFRRTQGDVEPLPVEGCKEQWQEVKTEDDDRRWWFLAVKEKGRLVTELYRSVGIVRTQWGDKTSLTIRVDCSGVPENAVTAMVRDLVDDFIWLIVENRNPLEQSFDDHSRGRLQLSDLLIARLDELTTRLDALLDACKKKLKVRYAVVPAHKAKPTGRNLLRRLRCPDSSAIWGEVVTEDADTGENRFMHATALRALRIIQAAIEIIPEQSSEFMSYRRELFTLRDHCRRVVNRYRTLGVGTENRHYNRIVMQSNPLYASVYRFQKALFAELAEWNDIADTFEAMRHIRVTHLSQIYERWCLVKIIQTLMSCYRFRPVGSWISDFVKAVVNGRHNVEVRLRHLEYGPDIIVSYEHELDPNPFDGKTYRPDFLVRLADRDYPKLVLDAKFRTVIGKKGCKALHSKLFSDKDYGENGRNLVFIVHPSSSRESYFDVLEWTGGWIYALAGQAGRDNIRLALLQWLQCIEQRASLRICPYCGHASHYIEQRATSPATKQSVCGFCKKETLWTRCFNCGFKPLIKNPGLNYFQTAGTQRNIICPRCGASFEPSSRRSGVESNSVVEDCSCVFTD